MGSSEMDNKVKLEVDSFVGTAIRHPEFRSADQAVRRVLRRLVTWSQNHPGLISHSPVDSLDQASVAFVKRSDENVLWKAYPGGRGSHPKVEFLVRGASYLPEEVWDEVVNKLRDLRLSSSPTPKVAGIAMRALCRDERKLEAALEFLEWAVLHPRIGSAS